MTSPSDQTAGSRRSADGGRFADLPRLLLLAVSLVAAHVLLSGWSEHVWAYLAIVGLVALAFAVSVLRIARERQIWPWLVFAIWAGALGLLTFAVYLVSVIELGT